MGLWYKGAPYTQYGPCYALSLPGHYPAVFPKDFQSEQLSVKEIGRLVVEAIEQIVPGRPVTIVGHSLGGFTALAAAIYAPAKVNRVISIAGFANGRLIGAFGLLQRLARMDGMGRVLFPLGFLTRFHPSFLRASIGAFAVDRQILIHHPEFTERLHLLYSYHKKVQAGAMWPYFRQLPHMDIAYRLPRIAAATLVVVSDKDPIVPPEQSQLIASRVPNSKLVVIPGVGHLPMLERRPEYEKIVHEWLSK